MALTTIGVGGVAADELMRLDINGLTFAGVVADGAEHSQQPDVTPINDVETPVRNRSYEHFLLMEHSYSRDWRPHLDGTHHIMTTRTIMVHRPPQCPSCHTHTHTDEGVDMNETYNPPIPTYDEAAARRAMLHSERIATGVLVGDADDLHLDAPNSTAAAAAAAADAHPATANTDSDHDWEETVDRRSWSGDQQRLFAAVARLLDLDRLARLANVGRLHEPVLRRCVIDKSVARMRKALAAARCAPALTQWLHALLCDHLPPTYMAAYLDVMQTLRAKVPALAEQMMRQRPPARHSGVLAPVLRAPWEPCVALKQRQLPGTAPVIVVVPAAPEPLVAPAATHTTQQQPPTSGDATTPQSTGHPGALPERRRFAQRWRALLESMAPVIEVRVPALQQPVCGVRQQTEHLVAQTRARVQEIRNEVAGRQIVLMGFGAGAAVAVQVACVELCSSVVCMGMAYNTVGGWRGQADDRVLDLTTPVLFVLGQNAARASQEEIESLRERMQAQTSLVVVGSADDLLRVGHTKRQIEGVTQNMVDNMIVDEVFEFAASCIVNPPAPRDLSAELAAQAKLANGGGGIGVPVAAPQPPAGSVSQNSSTASKKRKNSQDAGDSSSASTKALKSSAANSSRGSASEGAAKPKAPRKVGRPRNQPAANASTAASKAAATTAKSLAQPPSDETLNMAIASILPGDPVANDDDDDNAISAFELQPNMVLKPIQFNSGNSGISSGAPMRKQPMQQQQLQQPMQQQHASTSGVAAFQPRLIATTAGGLHISAAAVGPGPNSALNTASIGGPLMHQKIQLLPAAAGTNQFVKIRPPPTATVQMMNTAGGRMYAVNPAAATGQLAAAAAVQQRQLAAGGQSFALRPMVQQQPQPLHHFQSVPMGSVPMSTGQMGQMSKVYTVKSTPTGTQLQSVVGGGGQFISTQLRQPTQLVNVTTPKVGGGGYTIVSRQQQAPGGVGMASASGLQPQIIKLRPATVPSTADQPTADTSIFDMPIVFADNDGNIQSDGAASAGKPQLQQLQQQSPQQQQQQLKPLHIGTSAPAPASHHQQTAHLNRNIVINTIAARNVVSVSANAGPSNAQHVNIIAPTASVVTSATAATVTSSAATAGIVSGNKVVLINRSGSGQSIQIGGSLSNVTMLPAAAMQKFTKVNVSGAGSVSLPLRTNIEMVRAAPATGGAASATSAAAGGGGSSGGSPTTFALGNKVNLISNALIRPVTVSPSSSAAGAATAPATTTVVPLRTAMGTFNIMKPQSSMPASPASSSSSSPASPASAVGAVAGTSNTIVLKPGASLGSVQLKPGILSRSVTVRKVNLVPATQQQQLQLQQQMRNAAAAAAAAGSAANNASSPVAIGGGMIVRPVMMGAAAAAATTTTAAPALLSPPAPTGTQIVLQSPKATAAAAVGGLQASSQSPPALPKSPVPKTDQ